MENKLVFAHHAYLVNPQRCLPLEKPKINYLCSKHPIGPNTHVRIVNSLFQNVGLIGHFTKLSLRAIVPLRCLMQESTAIDHGLQWRCRTVGV